MEGIVQLGEPILTQEEAQKRMEPLLLAAERGASSRREKFTHDEREDIFCKFFASEEYIGPVTASAVAGWMNRNLKILPKSGGLKPFLVNDIQWRLLEKFCDALLAGRPLRFIILKARQFGISTLVQAFIFFLLIRYSGRNACVIAHKDDATKHLYAMTKRYRENMPHRPLCSALGEGGMVLPAPHDSRLTLETAGAKGAKRSFTIQYLHCSEPAFWPNPDVTDLGLMQIVPFEPGTIIVKESTANGVGGLFWRQYWDAKNKKSDYEAVFLPWYLHAEYRRVVTEEQGKKLMLGLDEEERRGVEKMGWTVEQVAWRRHYISNSCDNNVSKFHQEYPATDREAFLVSGRPVFDLHLLEARSEGAEDPVFQGILVYDGG